MPPNCRPHSALPTASPWLAARWRLRPGSLQHRRLFTGPLLLAAGIAAALRLARWRGLATVKEPLLLVLHLGHGWLAIGLVLLGASELTDLVPASAALHALTAGAIGTMILAVMTRATLGHTGHDADRRRGHYRHLCSRDDRRAGANFRLVAAGAITISC